MLFLLFQLGNDRYALEANRVVEVVPLLSLKQIPTAAKGVAGMFVYRGRAIPALDLCDLTMGRPARERLSTRIIIIEAGSSSSAFPAPCLLGLIAERATEMLQRDARDFVQVEVPSAKYHVPGSLTSDPSHIAPWLGPVLIDDRGVIQLLHAQKLLAENVRDLVFAATEDKTEGGKAES